MFFYELLLRLFGRQEAPASTVQHSSFHCPTALMNTTAANTSTAHAAHAAHCTSISCPTAVRHKSPVQPTPRRQSSFASPLQVPTPIRHVTNVAVAGPVGSGKTTLARAMVGLAPLPEKNHAPPCAEPVATAYAFPGNRLLQIWDLPGVPEGGEEPDLSHYEFFIVTASSRMTDEVVRLAREIEAMEKNFIFVRTKLDVYMQETQQENFEQSHLLKEVRKHFGKKLQDVGVQNPRIFLLSGLLPTDYEFAEFMEAFKEACFRG